ncbi:MAG: hypothetical protein CSA82_03010 [Actinobacteria bacterium]|nr:MAG: hypothetical protein CSA82_03010 [Actinomycetota bacterium]
MDIITAYLNTMFSPYPATPRMVEAREELRTMMEDKYTELLATGRSENEAVGQVITEFGNLEEIAPVLGISTEIFPGSNPSVGVQQNTGPTQGHAHENEAEPAYPVLTLDEAQAYADALKKTQPILTASVVLFVLAPILVASMPQIAVFFNPSLNEDFLHKISIILLLFVVILGVVPLVGRGTRLSRFEYIDKGNFTLGRETYDWAQALNREHETRRSRALMVAVGLWILSALPVISLSFIADAYPEKEDALISFGVAGTLVLVAIGLTVFLPTNWAYSASEKIFERASSFGHPQSDDSDPLVSTVAAGFFPLLAAVYLGWSFLFDGWSVSWIVWPFGAIIFGAFAAARGAWRSSKKNRSR